MAYSLSAKVTRIESALSLLGYFYDRLRYLCPTVCALIESAYTSGSFADCTFLADCHARMRAGAPFAESWEEALLCCRDALGHEECALLASLAQVIGLSDLESQLSAIAYTRERLRVRLETAREYQKTHAKLYRSLGTLAGIGIVILLG